MTYEITKLTKQDLGDILQSNFLFSEKRVDLLEVTLNGLPFVRIHRPMAEKSVTLTVYTFVGGVLEAFPIRTNGLIITIVDYVFSRYEKALENKNDPVSVWSQFFPKEEIKKLNVEETHHTLLKEDYPEDPTVLFNGLLKDFLDQNRELFLAFAQRNCTVNTGLDILHVLQKK